MRMFWQERSAAPLSGPVAARLAHEPGLGARDTSGLRMIEESGKYAGRSVMYFRVFDPAAVPAGVTVRRFRDLEGLTGVRSGHTERDGSVVLNRAAD